MYSDLQPQPKVQIGAAQPVVFLHLPKTAGTTLMGMLRRMFKPPEICPWYFMDEIPAHIEGYRLYAGHFYYSAISRLVSPDAIYLTCLREPVARTISNYYEIGQSVAQNPDFIPDFPPTLEEFVFNPMFNHLLSNVQTRVLGAQLAFSGLSDLPAAWRAYVKTPMVVAAESAFGVIDSMHFLGLTERFQETTALLSYTFGWPPMFGTQKLNTGKYQKRQQAVPPHVIEKIADLNQEDLKLYQYAAGVFEERYGDMLREVSRHYYLSGKTAATPLRSEMKIEFRQAPNDSFYPPDAEGVDQPFIWTGPEATARLDLALAGGNDLGIRLNVVDAMSPELLDSLKLSVNGYPVALQRFRLPEGTFDFDGVIPQAALSQGRYFSTLIFEIERTISPKERNPDSKDPRKLGIALGTLQIGAPRKFKRSATTQVIPADGLKANVQARVGALRVSRASTIKAEVTVTNTGAATWPSAANESGLYAICLGGYWTNKQGNRLMEAETRAQMPYDLQRGDSEAITLTLVAPSAAGSYTAHINMLQEGVAWFTTSPASIHFTVTE